MDEKIYLRLLYGMEEIPDGLARIIGRKPLLRPGRAAVA